MAVTLQLTQAGSGTTSIHANPGDTVTLVLASTVENTILANAVAALAGLSQVTGVTFTASALGNGS